MKKVVSVLLGSIVSLFVAGQNPVGHWNGTLEVQGTKLRIVFNVDKTDSGLVSTMDSPDQGAKGIPVSLTLLKDSTIKFILSNLKIEYEGFLKNDSIITGTFKQAGFSFPLNLTKQTQEPKRTSKVEENIKASYYSESVTFDNKKAGIMIQLN